MATFWEDNRSTKSPIEKYLTWKGAADGWVFNYYNKDAGENQVYKLKDIVILKTGYCIDGFCPATNKGIYSNNISFFNEEFVVKSGDRTLAEGIYKDIKSQIESQWGKLHLTVTALEWDSIIQLKLKGAAYAAFNDLMDSMDINANFVSFKGKEDKKNGAISYTVPVFSPGKALTKDAIGKATLAVELLKPQVEEEAPLSIDDFHTD